MFTICYISHAVDDLPQPALQNIFDTTENNNNSNDITGILLYESGNFMQVLEGEEEQLKTLFSKIEQDPRHRNILIILNEKVESRVFNDYASRFSVVKSKDDLQKIRIYLDKIDSATPNLKYIKGVLEPFLL